MKDARLPIPAERIEQSIFFIRGEKIMLSTDLGKLYGVAPRVLIQTIKRNIKRFPPDFMFQLTKEEFDNLKSQIVTSSWDGARRATEIGGFAIFRNPRPVAVPWPTPPPPP